VLNIAHRGASGLAPENTLVAFQLAIASGCDYVECDVHRSRDGHLVVVHDAVLSRVADVSARVGDLTLAELKQLDVGRWFGCRFSGERIPTLQEVAECARGRCGLSVEIKFGSLVYPGVESQVVLTLRRARALDNALISSFNFDAIDEVKTAAPEARVGVIFWGYSRDLVPLASRLRCEMLSLEQAFTTPAMIAAATAAGMWVNVFTVDEPEDIVRFANMGVGGISTNFPGRVAALLLGEA